MPRAARIAPAGLDVHVLNRGVAGLKLFRTEKDYAAFLQARCGGVTASWANDAHHAEVGC